jgi:hypothetical protein
VGAGDGFGCVECRRAWGDAVGCERFVGGVRDCFWREGMRQRFESGVVIEREVCALVGVDEDDDACAIAWLSVMSSVVRTIEAGSARSIRHFPAGGGVFVVA